MSRRQPQTVLVLGGIRSGKSAFAESLAAGAPTVRYVATAGDPDGDPEWAARIAGHRERRPESWTTEETGRSPGDLAVLIAGAGPDETVLIDDLGGWLTALLDTGLADHAPSTVGVEITDAVEALAVALTDTPAQVIVVSPEVGLSLVPTTPLGRVFADACGLANHAVAAVCDAVALVVAGQATWLKLTERDRGPLTVSVPVPRPAAQAVPVTVDDSAVDGSAVDGSTLDGSTVGGGALDGSAVGGGGDSAGGGDGGGDVFVGMSLPVPDHDAETAATEALAELDVAGPGLGALASSVIFAAGTRGEARPGPYRSIRVLLIRGAATGAAATGDEPQAAAARFSALLAGGGPLARLAADAGAGIEVLSTPDAGALEDGYACSDKDVHAALHRGWRAANAAADRGDDLIVLAADGPGLDASASAAVASITASEAPALLGRVWRTGGRIDDAAWMIRCVTIRDALLRVRKESGGYADGPTALAAFGGPAVATATGVILGAAARRIGVLIDGPVGAAAGLVARDYATSARLWLRLADHAGHPTVTVAANMLSLEPVVPIGLGLGEGTTSLSVLPLIQSALAVTAGG